MPVAHTQRDHEPIGPFQGMSDSRSAADAPLMLSNSGSCLRSTASMLQMTCGAIQKLHSLWCCPSPCHTLFQDLPEGLGMWPVVDPGFWNGGSMVWLRSTIGGAQRHCVHIYSSLFHAKHDLCMCTMPWHAFSFSYTKTSKTSCW